VFLTAFGLLAVVIVALEGVPPASADTAPFELFCTNTPIGNLVLNDVVVSGTLSSATPTVGQEFSLQGFQAQVTAPADVLEAASAVGNTSVSGTVTTSISATGATPQSMSIGPFAYDEAIPDPVPSTGATLDVPSAPATVGPFTATSSSVSLALGSSFTITFSDVAFPSGLPPLKCSAYPDDLMPSGLAQQAVPPGLPISPVIASTGNPPTTNVPALTGPYELYCPHTPVGDLDFNDVTTSATISSSTLSAGDQFQVDGYQVDIPVPDGLVAAAVGLSNSSFDGLATTNLEAYGASPAQLPTGSLGFDVPIPDPVPPAGLDIDMPATPESVGPFTAEGGPITIAQDDNILVVAELSSKAFTMTCTAYPNDSIASSGSTGTPPSATPIEPIVALASASGTSTTTTTTVAPGGPSQGQTPGAAYELYCPGTPVGDIAVNDVATTATITPSSLQEGDTFQLSDLQTTFSLPQSVAELAEQLGLDSFSGDLSVFFQLTGAEYGYSSPPGTVVYPGPDEVADLSFDVDLPSPVPSTGVQFTAAIAPGTSPPSFVAAGGPIDAYVAGTNLDVSAFGDQFGLFCDALTDNSVPTGLSLGGPIPQDLTEPLVTTGSATVVSPPPTSAGSYELFCPGTPVGDIALNDTVTSGALSPVDPAEGASFDLTDYQTEVTIPVSIVDAAAALGNTEISGSAVSQIDATGATPTTMTSGSMTFDVPIPEPVSSQGLTLAVPSAPATIGPFTADAPVVTLAQNSTIELTLIVSGNSLDLKCQSYPDDSLPSGITSALPSAAPISPVIASSAGTSSPPPTAVPEGTSPPNPSTSVPPATDASTASTSTTVASTNPGGSGSSDSLSDGSTSGGSGGDSNGSSGTVSASSGSLAFTGTGPGVELTAVAGAVALLAGLVLLAAVDVPRRLWRRLRGLPNFDDTVLCTPLVPSGDELAG